jgi:hypothetical protein
LSNKNIIEKELLPFETLDQLDVELDNRLNHLVILLENSKLDSRKAAMVTERVNKALQKYPMQKKIYAYQALDEEQSRLDMLDDLGMLLAQHPVDSAKTKKYLFSVKVKKVVQFLISLTIITLGLGMVILPAPVEFEMFTIFHFTQNDGVTLMDLISLIIIFTGVYLLADSLIKQRNQLEYK